MAGLSHNPNATYCSKRIMGEPSDPDATCDYCKARGMAPEAPSAPALDEDQRPEIVRLFEALGLVKGGQVSMLITNAGTRFEHLTIETVHGLSGDNGSTVITFRELGVSGHALRIPWRSISHWKSA